MVAATGLARMPGKRGKMDREIAGGAHFARLPGGGTVDREMSPGQMMAADRDREGRMIPRKPIRLSLQSRMPGKWPSKRMHAKSAKRGPRSYDREGGAGASREEVVEFIRYITDLPLNDVNQAVRDIFNALFDMMDADGDERISRPEFEEFAQNVKEIVLRDFPKVDTDGDDLVGAEDVRVYIAQWLGQDWDKLDNQVQFAMTLVWRFIDVNEDDKISLADLSKADEKFMAMVDEFFLA